MTTTHTTAQAITSLPLNAVVEREGMPLRVVLRAGLINWTPELGAEGAEEVTLTSDGRQYAPGWHSGDVAEWVYVERWTRGVGRTFHGWIDSVSRQLVQAG